MPAQLAARRRSRRWRRELSRRRRAAAPNARVRKSFIIDRAAKVVSQRAVVAIAAHTGNLLTEQKTLPRSLHMQAAGGDVRSSRRTARENRARARQAVARAARERARRDDRGDDDVGVAKALMALQKKVPSFFVLGATLGERTLEWSDVERLAKLPPREEVFADLLAQIMPGGRLQVPQLVEQQLAGPVFALGAPGTALLQLLEARIAQLKNDEGG